MRDGVDGQHGGFLRAGVAQHQNGLCDTGPAQTQCFGKTRNGKPAGTGGLQRGGNHRIAVAVGVGFHHRHDLAVGRVLLDHLKIVLNFVKVHLCPAAFFKLPHRVKASFPFAFHCQQYSINGA
ncbi:hypothetical protein SDC9_119457 [bioreactor metagenome]|uniref:Uncharacterized protein n=1 Tax=bioreactor metagenome TaxID=1076179 RepID=A0A645C660_9ZZZZ